MQPEFLKTPDPECNSIQELYEKNNRSKYLPWFIVFALFLTVVLILQIGAILHLGIKSQIYYDGWRDILTSSGRQGNQVTQLVERAFLQRIIFGTFIVGFSLTIYIYFIIETIRSNQKKDYSSFSKVLNSLISFVGFITTINLIFNLAFGNFRFVSWDINGILFFAATLTFVFAYIFIYTFKVRRIVYKFAYEAFLINQKNSSPVDDVFRNMFSGQSTTTPNKDANENVILGAAAVAAATTANNEYRTKLQLLDREQLLNMANKLNIYGASEFSNEQLMDKIAAIFEEKQRTVSTTPASSSSESNQTFNSDKKPTDSSSEDPDK